MRKNRLESHLYYGLAILAVLFVVVGLTAALKGTESTALKDEKSEEVLKVKKEEPGKEEKPVEKEETKAKNPNIRVLLMTDGYQYTTQDRKSTRLNSSHE